MLASLWLLERAVRSVIESRVAAHVYFRLSPLGLDRDGSDPTTQLWDEVFCSR